MTTERDTLLESLFEHASESPAQDDFADRVMLRIDRARRRSLAGWAIVGFAALAGAWMLSGPLLQALNLSQKTGVLMLTLSEGLARLYMRDGNLVFADYHNLHGLQALYGALKESEGRFKFDPNFPEEHQHTPPLGPMMEILLEMSRRIDEQHID